MYKRQKILVPIYALNGWGEAPRIEVDTSAFIDPAKAAEILSKVSAIGNPDVWQAAIQEIMDLTGLPPAEFPTVDPNTPSQPPVGPPEEEDENNENVPADAT